MKGINNLAKKYFLAQFKIVPNFHYFCKVRANPIFVKKSIFQKLPNAPVEFPSKIQFSKNCLKLWRNTSFDERNKLFSKKYFFSTI